MSTMNAFEKPSHGLVCRIFRMQISMFDISRNQQDEKYRRVRYSRPLLDSYFIATVNKFHANNNTQHTVYVQEYLSIYYCYCHVFYSLIAFIYKMERTLFFLYSSFLSRIPTDMADSTPPWIEHSYTENAIRSNIHIHATNSSVISPQWFIFLTFIVKHVIE